MRKLLIATTALTLAGGAAFAELSMSGSGELGINYDSEEAVKHTFVHQVDIDFAGSGTTDGGLSFGGSVGFNSDADDDGNDIDTGTVYISGGFGTLTIGDNNAADKLSGGIADVGMNAIGVDDAGETLYGSTAAQLRYDQSFGAASIAVSAGNKEAGAKSPYAVGLSFSAGDIRIGVGYDSAKVVSFGAGYSVANISVNGFYSSHSEHLGSIAVGTDGKVDSDADKNTVTFDYKGKANTIGADLTYTLGATALTVAYSKLDVKAVSATHTTAGDNPKDVDYVSSGASLSSVGVGITHDLGGGASVNAGFGKVETLDLDAFVVGKANDDGAFPVTAAVKDTNKASIGITLAF